MKLSQRVLKAGKVSLIAMSCFTAASVAQPRQAHAILSAFANPAAPFIIAGAVLVPMAIVDGAVATDAHIRGFLDRAITFDTIASIELLAGIVLLGDNAQGDLAVQQLTSADQAKYKLTDAEVKAYNKAAKTGVIEAMLQGASSALNRLKADVKSGVLKLEQALGIAKNVMKDQLDGIQDQDAAQAFQKIAQYNQQQSVQQ